MVDRLLCPSIVCTVVSGVEYEVANFTTVPYMDVGEYKVYRSLKERVIADRKDDPSRALRTVYDWTKFFRSVKRKQDRAATKPDPQKGKKQTGRKKAESKDKEIQDKARADRAVQKKIINCLYAHKAGVLKIPLLEQDAELFIQALNKSGICQRRYTKDNLKNYAKSERWCWPVCEAVEGRGEDNLKHFLAEQEPVLGWLLALQAEEPSHEG